MCCWLRLVARIVCVVRRGCVDNRRCVAGFDVLLRECVLLFEVGC